MKGISETISFVILVGLALTLAALIGPWVYRMATDRASASDNQTTTTIKCGEAGYDFVSSYGTSGVIWNSTANALWAKIKNTGNTMLYDFSFEVNINSTSITSYQATAGTRKSSSNPLRPGESIIIKADITDNLNSSTVNSVKVLNSICPQSSPSAVSV